jgi:hypothetical protein
LEIQTFWLSAVFGMSINLEKITVSPQCVIQAAFMMDYLNYLRHIGAEPRHARMLEPFIVILKAAYSFTYRVLIKKNNSRLEEVIIQKCFLSLYGRCIRRVAFYKKKLYSGSQFLELVLVFRTSIKYFQTHTVDIHETQ